MTIYSYSYILRGRQIILSEDRICMCVCAHMYPHIDIHTNTHTLTTQSYIDITT